MEEQQRTPEKPSSAPSTDSSPDTLRPSSGTTTPRVLVDNVAKWKLPQHLLIKVLTLLPPSDPLTIHTLLNARQVSKRFEIMANVPSTWDSQLALWSKSAAPQWIQLPPTCDKEDQEEIDRIFPERKCPSLRGRDEYRARWLLDRLAGDHLIHLVDSETDKIKSFELLCAVGKQAWDRVLLDPFRLTRTEAEEDDDEGEDDLAALYWSMEVRRSIERRAAAAIWRAIDSGELGRDDWERREWGIAAFAGFAGGNIMQAHETFDNLFRLIDASFRSILPDPWRHCRQLALTVDEDVAQAQLLTTADSILSVIRQHLWTLQLDPTPSEFPEAKRLDSCFLNLVEDDAHYRRGLVARSTLLSLDLQEREASVEEIEALVRNVMKAATPTANLTLYTHLLVAEARRFGLYLWPTIDKSLLAAPDLCWRWFSDDGKQVVREIKIQCLLGVLGGEAFIRPRVSPHAYDLLTPWCSIRRVASDICTSLSSPEPLLSDRVTHEEALYAELLVPSVLSRPYQGPEAALRLTAASTKLANHVGRCFPFDVRLLEQVVLPLVYGEHARGVVMEVIRKAREQDHVIVPKRREGESPIGRVGQVCAEKAVEDKFGVIVGWDESFSKQTCKKVGQPETEVAPETLLAGKHQPFYHILWEPYINSPTFTYAAEETLDLDLVWGKSFDRVEVSNISDVHEVGRYFGSWWETTGSAEPCFMLSPEWRARYPDD